MKPPKFTNDFYKNPFDKDYLKDPFKLPKEKKEKVFHTITFYEENLIRTICPAVIAKQKIRFWYSDKTKDYEDFRTVEPHLIGRNRNTGFINLSAWFLPTQEQVWEGATPRFHVYCLENISKIEMLNETFKTTRRGYNPNDTTMCKIYCRTQEVQNLLYQ